MLCELLRGNVRHHEECKHTFDGAAVTAKGGGKDLASAATAKGDAEDLAPAETAKGDQRLQIAVMIRSDVFRDCRARKINSTLGPVELFRVVNCTVAQHLADVPVALPDMLVCVWAGSPRGHASVRSHAYISFIVDVWL